MYAPLHRLCPKTANAACDQWINNNIVAADPDEEIVAMPRDEQGNPVGLLDKRFQGMTVKNIFDILYAEKQEGGGG